MRRLSYLFILFISYIPTNDAHTFKCSFVDMTWGAGGSTSKLTMDLCCKIQQSHGAVANMHLTCTNVDKEQIKETLRKCTEEGIVNILALRGDPPAGQVDWKATDGGFQCARELVSYIRSSHGDYFHITVAGYPEGHPNRMEVIIDGFDSLSINEQARCSFEVDENGNETVRVCRDAQFEEELRYLKSKVDAGADCIITQMFFDCSVFENFVARCREIGITVPIIPVSNILIEYRKHPPFVNILLYSGYYVIEHLRWLPTYDWDMQNTRTERTAPRCFKIQR
jgi:methylenetetrahydrofolate reductase (NADPH)